MAELDFPDSDFSREMGLTHREFFRTLPSAMGDYNYTVNGNRIEAILTTGSLTIELAPESVRKIASFVIPKTGVKFSFSGVSDEERLSFITYFDRRFQRGGG